MSILENPLSPLAQKALDALAFNQRLMANNVAKSNLSTYRAKHLDFESYIQEASRANRSITMDRFITIDKNEVSVDKELALISENLLRYQSIMEVMRGQKSLLRLAVTGRSQ